MPLTRTHNSP